MFEHPQLPPRGWTLERLGEIVSLRNGINFTQGSSGELIRIVGVADFWQRSRIEAQDVSSWVEPNGETGSEDLLRDGDLLFVRSNGNKALIGRCMLVYPGSAPITFSGFTIRARLTSKATSSEYLARVLQSSLFKRQLHLEGGGTNISNLSQGTLASFAIPLPPLSEQALVSTILMKWDRAIEALDRQITSKEKVIGHLRESFAHGLRRLNKRSGTWPMVKLGEVTDQLHERNGIRFGRDSVMGVTKVDGLVPMKEHVIAEEITRYLVLPTGAFAYNPMRINIGSIVMSALPDTVIVSPDYVVFACKPTQLDPRFLNHLRKTKAWSDFMNIAGNGSVRIRIYFASLADFEFHLPPLSEQKAIVEVLDDAEREVAALRSERAALDKQRDGLSIELLSGHLRVATPGGSA